MSALASVPFDLTFNSRVYRGFAALPSDVPSLDALPASRPIVLIFPNYCGLKELEQRIAGWWAAATNCLAIACDYYTAEELPYAVRDCRSMTLRSEDYAADALQDHFRRSFAAMNECLLSRKHSRFRPLLKAWVARAREMSRSGVPHPILATGYCLGGVAVLELFRSGEQLAGAVSVHGVLETRPQEGFGEAEPEDGGDEATPNCLNLLVEHGRDDHLVPKEMLKRFEEEMQEMHAAHGVTMKMHVHEAGHGFAIPMGWGKSWDEKADRDSAKNMLDFYDEITVDYGPPAIAQRAALGTPGGGSDKIF